MKKSGQKNKKISLAKDTERLLGKKGRLSTAIANFNSRPSQVALATTIAKTIEENSILVAEAGTGTGKTFSYLIPSILSGKKILISTATKTLQDQLFQKDLPMLLKALGRALKVQNLKGRANYLCRYRIELHLTEGRFPLQQNVDELLYVAEKLPQLVFGERNELPEMSDDSFIWPYVTSTADNCLGAECPHQKNCFLVKARKEALKSDIVVINHHLYFSDSKLKEEGFGELLPAMQVVIFDEAHQLIEIAASFFGERFGSRQFFELLDEIIAVWPAIDLANQPLKHLRQQAEQVIENLMSVLKADERYAWEEIKNQSIFQQSFQVFIELTHVLIACFEGIPLEENKELSQYKIKLEWLIKFLSHLQESNHAYIRWIECFKHHFVFNSTPYEVANLFKQTLNHTDCAYVFTSATLSYAKSFDCFTKALGLEDSIQLLLPSPFNFKEQALLYLPRYLPDPNDKDYFEVLVARTLPIINACKGRCFFLFTSHRALKIVTGLLKNQLPYPLLIQGDEAKPILLNRFRELGNAILLGTSTFWQGVDVKGEALSCVIIDKLPFSSPADPVNRGRMAYLKARGISGFDELTLPQAVLTLKQGVGRLIRDENDKGIMVIADPRLTARSYGKAIFASLPPMQRTRDEQKVLEFINEIISN